MSLTDREVRTVLCAYACFMVRLYQGVSPSSLKYFPVRPFSFSIAYFTITEGILDGFIKCGIIALNYDNKIKKIVLIGKSEDIVPYLLEGWE